MAHIVLTALRGFLLIYTIESSANALEIKGNLPDASAITNFLDSFLKPYMQTIFTHRNTPTARAIKNEIKVTRDETTVESVIEDTIAELKPLLQDDDEKDFGDNFTLEGNDDETTIIEFLPNIGRTGVSVDVAGGGSDVKTIDMKPDSFKANIKKYKKMRGKIKKMLHKENVSNNTRDTVLNTLDDIIAQLIENQCTWKTVDRPDSPAFRNHQLHNSISRIRSLSDDQWSEMKSQYEGFLQEKLMQENSFLDMFHDFFNKVVNDTQALSKKYKIRCQLIEIEKDRQEEPTFRAFGESSGCENFKLCSEELKELMTDFYSHLNDTAVSAYKNYAAMYDKDVNMDVDLDKDLVVSIVTKLGDVAEQKVAKVFKKQTKNIELDKHKDRSANIRHLNDYIKSTVEHVKKHLKKRTETDLNTLRTKLYLSIKEDLDVNLDVDLGNLERLFIDRVCTRFVLCNGRYSSRRQSEKNFANFKDNNNVYVKVQLTLDDEMKQELTQSQYKLANFVLNNTAKNKGPFRKHIFNESYSNFTATRTTANTEAATVTTNATTADVDTHINEI